VVIDATYKLAGKQCKLTFAKETITYFSPMSYAYAKDGPFTKPIDHM